MKVQVRYFASIREILGAGEAVEIDAAATVGMLRDALIARGAPHAEVLARGLALRSAIDHAMCDEAAPLRDGVEVAFFPPVTGG